MKKKYLNLLIFLGIVALVTFLNVTNVFASTTKKIGFQDTPKYVSVGSTFDVTVYVEVFEGAYDRKINWSSSNNSIAKVESVANRVGKITGVSDGNATITACVNDEPDICSSFSVAIGSASPNRVRVIEMDQTEGKVAQGKNVGFHINPNMNGVKNFKGGVGEDEYVIWSSSNDNIAKVRWDGEQKAIITGISPGEVVIKACLLKQSTICASSRIKVTASETTTSEHEDRVESLKINKSSLEIQVGQTDTIDVDYVEKDPSKILSEGKIDITWYSSDNSIVGIAKRNRNTAQVYGNAEGTSKIKACMSNGMCTPEIEITVKGTVNGSLNYDGTTNTGTGTNGSPQIDVPFNDQQYSCEGLIADELEAVIQFALKVLRIAAPILLLILCVVDFSQAVISGDQDALKKSTSKVVKRAIAALALFLVPFFVSVAIDWVENSDYFNKDNANCTEVLE